MEIDALTEEYNNKLRELECQYKAQKDKIESEYESQVLSNKCKRDKDDTLDISIAPLRKTLSLRGMKFVDLTDLTGIKWTTISQVSYGRSMFKSDKIALIAAKLQVPVSSVIEFNGFVPKPTLAKRYGDLEEFVIPENIEGIVTYKPLFDLVKSFYSGKTDKKTVSDLFDMIPAKVDGRSNNKGSIEGIRKALITRGIDPDNPKHNREVITGMPTSVRSKINHDKPVNMRVIYEICKILKCNVDFVMGWK